METTHTFTRVPVPVRWIRGFIYLFFYYRKQHTTARTPETPPNPRRALVDTWIRGYVEFGSTPTATGPGERASVVRKGRAGPVDE